MKFKDINEMAISPKKINNKDIELFMDKIEKQVDQYISIDDNESEKTFNAMAYVYFQNSPDIELWEKFNPELPSYKSNLKLLNNEFKKRYLKMGWKTAKIKSYEDEFKGTGSGDYELTIHYTLKK